MKIVHFTREYRGLGEAGGIKDVVTDLATSLVTYSNQVMVFTPYYGFLKSLIHQKTTMAWQGRIFQWEAMIHRLEIDGVILFLVETPWFNKFEGVYTYTKNEAAKGLGVEGNGYEEEVQRNLSFQRAIVVAFPEIVKFADAIHAHDAHTALIGGFVSAKTKVLTIHNAGYAYQQNIKNQNVLFEFFPELENSWQTFLLGDAWSPLLYAFTHSRVFTVSPYYAQEIMRENGFEETGPLGPEIVKHGYNVKGIFNGLNFERLKPKQDELLFELRQNWQNQILNRTEFKSKAKELFIKKIEENFFMGSLPNREIPWFSFHARLTRQKGVDDVLDILDQFNSLESQLVIMGQGEQFYREQLETSAKPGSRLCYLPFYNEELLHYFLAASDFFMMPSYFEPCSLTDLMAMFYGAVPLVRKTGGLQKVRQGREGFVFSAPQTLWDVVQDALEVFQKNPTRIDEMAYQGLIRIKDFDIMEIVQDVWLRIYAGLEPKREIW